MAVTNLDRLTVVHKRPLSFSSNVISPESFHLGTTNQQRKGSLPDNPPRVDHAWNPPQNAKQDVDQDIGATAALEEDTQSVFGQVVSSYFTHIRAYDTGVG